jgi:hypothetical protein
MPTKLELLEGMNIIYLAVLCGKVAEATTDEKTADPWGLDEESYSQSPEGGIIDCTSVDVTATFDVNRALPQCSRLPLATPSAVSPFRERWWMLRQPFYRHRKPQTNSRCRFH